MTRRTTNGTRRTTGGVGRTTTLQAVPDELFHWRIDEGSGSTLTDSADSADGTINGASWRSDADRVGGYELSFDGVDDYVDTTSWGSFGSNMDTDFAIALTLSIDGEDGRFLGVEGSDGGTGRTSLFLTHGSPFGARPTGTISFDIRDSDGDNVEVITDKNNFNAGGGPWRFVFNKNGGNTASNMEIWFQGGELATNTFRDEGFSNPVDFDTFVAFGADNDADAGVQNHMDCKLDNIKTWNSSLSQSEINQDYNDQPWS